MERGAVIGFIEQLLYYNPLYYVFPGTASLAFATAAACFIGAIMAFIRRHIDAGVVLVIATYLTVNIAASLTNHDPNAINPSWLWNLTLLLVAGTCYTAYKASGNKADVRLQVSLALLATSLYATFASDGMVIRYTATPSADFWLNASSYLWGADFVLIVTVAVLAVRERLAARRNGKEDPGAGTDDAKKPE